MFPLISTIKGIILNTRQGHTAGHKDQNRVTLLIFEDQLEGFIQMA